MNYFRLILKHRLLGGASVKKTYILDTNVLLYDARSMYAFGDNDIIIPIVVLEELDRFKKGNDVINLNARQVVRDLNKLSDSHIGGAMPLGEGLGELVIPVTGYEFPEDFPIFNESTTDHRILAYYLNAKKSNPELDLVLVTKDINLRMKARAMNINAQDYETGKIDDPHLLYDGYRIISGCDAEFIDSFFYEDEVPTQYIDNPIPNECYVLKNGSHSVLARYNGKTNNLVKISSDHFYGGIRGKNLQQTFALSVLSDPNIPLVTLTGKAGTGKTLLALAAAIEQRRRYQQIFLARPIVPLGNDIGFLPGDINAKLDPYMQPLFDNLAVIKEQSGEGLIKDMLEKRKIEIIPLPYLRGRSLPKVFFIVDEAQNLTPHEIKTIITRLGEGSKLVFTGDIFQIDSHILDSRSNGLSYLIHKMKGQKLFAHINLIKGERSELAELASNIL